MLLMLFCVTHADPSWISRAKSDEDIAAQRKQEGISGPPKTNKKKGKIVQTQNFGPFSVHTDVDLQLPFL